MTVKNHKKNWSDEEDFFLQEHWGDKSFNSISKHLDRSSDSIEKRAHRLNLGATSQSFDGITIHELSHHLEKEYRSVRNWITSYNFPVSKRILARKRKVLVVNIDKFWKWAKEHKQMIDFWKVEKNILGEEPEWVQKKRNADFLTHQLLYKNHTPWSSDEDKTLIKMLRSFSYTYPDLSKHFHRSEATIKARITSLKIPERPVRFERDSFEYTDNEINIILTMYNEGHSFEVISTTINRSALGIRGKLEKMGYSFRNGLLIKKKEL